MSAEEDNQRCPDCGFLACICHRDDGEPEIDDGWETGENCGRWINGRLGSSCMLAGTEECDWDCPYSR
jgi:hypothetical protein